MSLRCKPGDLAVIVSVRSPEMNRNIGVFCTVVAAGPMDGSDPTWQVETQTPALRRDGSVSRVGRCRDISLRPIRDRPGEDETLTWAGKPNETPTEIIEGATHVSQ